MVSKTIDAFFNRFFMNMFHTKSLCHSIGLAGTTRLTWSDFRLNLILLKSQRFCRLRVGFSSILKKFRKCIVLSIVGLFVSISEGNEKNLFYRIKK